MTSYSKTYAGIIIVILGWLGVSHLVTNDEVATTIDNIIQVIGIVTAIYGRYKAGGVNIIGIKTADGV